MKQNMNRDRRILAILAILIAVALLATYWSMISPVGSPPERLVWGRWNLTDEQREEIEQLIRNLQTSGTRPEAIEAAILAKINEWHITPPLPGDIELFYTVRTVISTINVALVAILLFTYIEIYHKTKSSFTVGLMMFSVILVFYTLASNPIMQWVFGFRAFGLGPFAMLPDIFACIALSVLLYLSVKY
jgi:hypothetical protein